MLVFTRSTHTHVLHQALIHTYFFSKVQFHTCKSSKHFFRPRWLLSPNRNLPLPRIQCKKWQSSNGEPAISQVSACLCFQSWNEQNRTSPYLAFLRPEKVCPNCQFWLCTKSSTIYQIYAWLQLIHVASFANTRLNLISFTKLKTACSSVIKGFLWSCVRTGCII